MREKIKEEIPEGFVKDDMVPLCYIAPKEEAEEIESQKQKAKGRINNALLITAAAGVGLLIGAPFVHLLANQENSLILESNLNAEQQKVLDEIQRLRLEKQLPSLPECLMGRAVLFAKRIPEWTKDNNKKTSSGFSESSESHEIQVTRVLELLFGENYPRLISKISPNKDATLYGSFPESSGLEELTIDVNQDPSSKFFLWVCIHEAMHSIDLNHLNDYPLDKLLRLVSRVERILYKLDKMPGKLMDNPAFYNTRYLHKLLGEGVAKSFLENPTGRWLKDNPYMSDDVDTVGYNAIIGALDEIVIKQNCGSREKIIFNKEVCNSLGEKLYPLVMSNQIKLSGNLLKEYYIKPFEAARSEMFAELVSLIIIDPSYVEYDPEILAAISEILSEIQERPVDVLSVSAEINALSSEVKTRYAAEQAVVSNSAQASNNSVPETQAVTATAPVLQTVATPNPAVIEPEEAQEIAKQVTEEQLLVDNLNDFIYKGKIPTTHVALPFEGSEVFQSLADVVNKVVLAYPTILEATIKDNLGFDPKRMHAWDSMKIAEAWNIEDLQRYIRNPNLVLIERLQILEKIKVLEGFCNDATVFGS